MPKARARMLASSISTSPRVNAMALKSVLIYTWLLSHCDDQGRMPADAATLKGIVCPLRTDISERDIGVALAEMEERNLIETYTPEELTYSPVADSPLLQILDWWDYQHLRDPKPSKYPAPRGWQDKVGGQARDARGRYSNE